MSQQINLYNPIFLTQKKYLSALAMLQALALMLGGILLVQAFAVHQRGELESLLAEVVRDAQLQRERVVALGKQFSAKGASKTLEEEVVRTEDQLRRRRELMIEMTTNVGGDVDGFSGYLKALARQPTQGVWLTAVEISSKSNDLVIRGRALDPDLVPAYVRALSREPAFAGRTVRSLQITSVTAAPAPEPAARLPTRYLEFVLNIPLGGTGLKAPASPAKAAS